MGIRGTESYNIHMSSIQPKVVISGRRSKTQDSKEGKRTVFNARVEADKDKNKKAPRDYIQATLEKMRELMHEEKEDKAYEEILRKINEGDDLSDKELEYLSKKDHKLYLEVQSEIQIQKQFEERLKQCKSKEEAKDTYIQEEETIRGLCGLKGNSGVKPNKVKYARLMKRINKSWVKYQKGELKKQKPQSKTSVTKDIVKEVIKEAQAYTGEQKLENKYDEKI